MRYTPVELRHVRMGRAILGYKRDEVERVLEDVADSFEEVWRDRGELADKIEETEKELAELRQREVLLSNTLISAERAASEATELAKREAEVIVAEAHQEARSIVRTAQTERERLFTEARRVEALLRSALGVFGEADSDDLDELASLRVARWPRREDTREFEVIPLPPQTDDGVVSLEPAETALTVSDDDAPSAGRDFVWG
jgi:cell division septum initiation protein DivIVA